jgi:2-oxoglutarate/2-oxoacid ferredoxin oxidoreductase subunit beta
MSETKPVYTIQDFKSDQEIRWCAGCGDIAIINAVQKAMAELGHKKEDYAFISGIGCSSRFPYYMNTYGFHGIHGRAGAIASGVKTANPRLSVWQITGDGDALAIGGNHFIHEIRRNLDINVILFNNEIYGLTKGQFSPTSRYGQVTKTSPYGTIESPFNPGELTIGAQGKFFARGIDNNVKLNIEIFKEADSHRGASIIEILQNCVIFNDGAHDYLNDKEFKAERQLFVKQGQPLIFGNNYDKGLVLDGLKLKVVKIGENGIKESDILVHDAKEPDPSMHLALINMQGPEFPVAFGVIRSVAAPTYDERTESQIAEIQKKSSIKCMDDLMNSGNTWMIE